MKDVTQKARELSSVLARALIAVTVIIVKKSRR